MKEAKHYIKIKNEHVQCKLCPHECIISPQNVGICRVRKNIEGVIYSTNYGKTMSLSIDPIEKKPLFHFYPGEQIISIGPNACNLSCKFCQNYRSSQQKVPTTAVTSGKILELCKNHLSKFVAFTYTEPTTWFEFVLDTAKLLQENGIKTVMVTNGYINQKPLEELLPYIDAMNIDLKSMQNDFYKNICNATLKPVLDTIRTAAKKCHIEITNLLVTEHNDSDEQIQKVTDFIAQVNKDIPVHFSRYFPMYKMDDPPTPIQRLNKAKQIAEQKLSYVYLGNIHTKKDTNCPKCGFKLIKRGFTSSIDLIGNQCPQCGHEIYGKFTS